MTDRCKDHAELTQEFHLAPNLATAISEWDTARHGFQNGRGMEHQDAYCKATDELGQAISRWRFEQPELFEQFKFRYEGHGSD
jgi:hypothetical protein